MTNTVTHPGYTTTVGGLKVVHPATVVAEPRYIPVHSKMYEDIVAAHGQLNSFGMNFADKLLSHHSSVWAAIPFLLLVVAAVGLQYLQMSRLNARNPQAAQANPQAAMLQKYMPLIFGFIYLNVAAILNVYFIVSSAIRILTQEVLFRRGIVGGPPPPPTAGGDAPVRKGPKPPVVDRTERALPRPKAGSSSAGSKNGAGATGATKTPAGRRPTAAKPTAKPGAKPGAKAPAKASRPTQPARGGANGRKPGVNGAGTNRTGAKGGQRSGSNGRAAGADDADGASGAKAHPRSKSKRETKGAIAGGMGRGQRKVPARGQRDGPRSPRCRRGRRRTGHLE